MIKRSSVSIGIPAHNEEANIEALLRQLIEQKKDQFFLKEILVVCDGCTDKTSDIVTKFAKKYPKVRLVNDGLRKGKAKRIQEIFEMFKGDFLVCMDADMKLGCIDALDHMVSAFYKDVKVGLVSARDLPLPEKGVIARAIVLGNEIWYLTRENINKGDTVHNIHGCVYALRKSFAKALMFPPSLNGDDHYLYWSAKQLGYKFKFVKEATFYYKSTDNLKDFYRQSSRFVNVKLEMIQIFGNSIKDGYIVPRQAKLNALKKVFLREPFLFFLAVCIQFGTKFTKYFYKNERGAIWTTALSTKVNLN